MMTLSNIINMQKVNPFLLFFMINSIHLSSLLDRFLSRIINYCFKGIDLIKTIESDYEIDHD
jgi:hypothetical protein